MDQLLRKIVLLLLTFCLSLSAGVAKSTKNDEAMAEVGASSDVHEQPEQALESTTRGKKRKGAGE